MQVFKTMGKLFPWLEVVFADGAYSGEKLADALAEIGPWRLEIVKQSDTAKASRSFARRCDPYAPVMMSCQPPIPSEPRRDWGPGGSTR